MNIIAIVQARMASKRLPGKVMKCIGGIPMIELQLRRLSYSKKIAKIVLSTSIDSSNDVLAQHIVSCGYEVFRGSEHDVLGRFYETAKFYDADTIVRITGDCPLVDPFMVDDLICEFESQAVDYLSNTLPALFPDGLDAAVFSNQTLEKTHLATNDKYNREHVTPYMRESGRFKLGAYLSEQDYSNERWTVDEITDFHVIESVFKHFHPRVDFGWEEILTLKHDKPHLFSSNQSIKRNEGADMTTGQKLWRHAKKIIPGGNMLLSKRPEMFLPNKWPSYFKKSKGCYVWDLDDNQYIDMSIMGIGTNTLGYGHSEIDEAVKQTIDNGNMSTLNCPEEVYLADKLITLNPWADMVRFARTGGEANAIAIRIARAASGKSKVAFCGYHGWHDWYLAANLTEDSNLSGHLLPGLEPNGVPENLMGSIYPFEYNNFQQLENIIQEHDIGVIKMEVKRNIEPEDNFLGRVREIADKNNIVLIFDECTSGFRETFGGLYQNYNIEPDMAVYGKALGNGYAITAIVGRKEIMESAQSTFISSTFWTERIGPTAALKTLEVMEKIQSWEIITEQGKKISQLWEEMAAKYTLPIKVFGMPALIKFTFESSQALHYKTFITQEMLKKGYLASNCVYVCTEHTDKIIQAYAQALDPIFAKISACEQQEMTVESILECPLSHTGFNRLN